jgi:predicted  nucleic acid-binding Zn-ribbon protein
LSETMTEELALMMTLQRKDMELKKLAEKCESIPKVIKETERRLEEEQQHVAQKEEELKALAAKRRSFERDLEEMERKTREKESQLLKVANNKEYQALLAEISNAKALQSNSEGDLLRMMEQEEVLAGELKTAREELNPMIERTAQSTMKLQEELKHNESLIPGLEKDRESVAAMLRPEVRSRYERIAKGKHGLAVVPVRKGACGGCFTALPAQMINEIRRNDRLISCEHCGRVLVWEEEGNSLGGSS